MKENGQDYDAIVVGTGPGGASVALELTKAGKKVLILERGKNPRLRGTVIDYILYQCIPFRSMLFTPQLLGMVRGLITGGSSVFYYGTCFPVPIEMLKKYGVDISSQVKEVRKDLPIAPLRDDIMGPKAKLIEKSALELGYDWKRLEKFMYQDRWTREQKHGEYYYGDPNDVKWNARLYIDEAVSLGAVLVTGAKVKKVLEQNDTAVGVEFSRKGRKVKAYAPKVVIAAGGIGSPVILRKSGISRAGYDYFFDPLVSVVGYVKNIPDEKEIPMSGGILLEEEGYVMTDMALPRTLNSLFAFSAFRFHRIFSHKKRVRIMIKAKDTLGGRLTDRGGVRKRLIKEDMQKLERGYRRAKEILERAGAKGIYQTWKLAAHPGGTIRIGDLVDSNLETRIKNCHVCDCSVIPEAWGLPPTLTLLALGKRLGQHLADNKIVQKKKPAEKKRNKTLAKK